MRLPWLLIALFFAIPFAAAADAIPATAAPRIIVRFDPALGELRGRLLVFLTRAHLRAHGPFEPEYTHPRDVEILGVEIPTLPAGARVELPVEAAAYPAALRDVAAGRYTARAELDVQHRYAYDGGQPGDPISANLRLTLAPGVVSVIGVHARRHAEPPGSNRRPSGVPGGREVSFVSPSLSAFAGRRVIMRAYVAPPLGYATSGRRYATVYVIGGYGTSRTTLAATAAEYARAARAAGGGRDLIYVFLDPRVPLGHSVFADSVNNGPWGHALTAEFIPSLEAHWRMIGAEATRYLTGHSSGGWSTLWLQTTYPTIFGGTWSTSPDPLDFHAFTGPDILAPRPANFYLARSGRPFMLVREHGRDVVALRDYARQERALGDYGGQFGSFDAVFSPRGADGRPQPLFDRTTGRIDPAVAHAWEARYDIVRNLRRDWPRIGPDLHGKLHVIVGSWDTFHLDAGVIRLRTLLQSLPGSDATIEIAPHRDHFNLYGGPRGGLIGRFDREMRAAAAHAGRSDPPR